MKFEYNAQMTLKTPKISPYEAYHTVSSGIKERRKTNRFSKSVKA